MLSATNCKKVQSVRETSEFPADGILFRSTSKSQMATNATQINSKDCARQHPQLLIDKNRAGEWKWKYESKRKNKMEVRQVN